jgi:hypothetical protein
MFSQLIIAVIVVAFYGGILDRAVHSLDLAICPWMIGFGQSMFYPVRLADHVEAHLSGIDGIAVSALLCELDAIIRQDGVDFVGHSFQHELKNSQAVRLSAVSASWVKANLLVRSMATNRYSHSPGKPSPGSFSDPPYTSVV